MSVYKKLSEARTQFHTMELKKSGENTFAKYKYFELADFLRPALKIFDDVGLCAVTTFTNDTATMRIFDIDDPQQFVEFTSPMGSAALKGCHEVQNIGAVETYQRRYLWTVALEIIEHDALDSVTGDGESKVAYTMPQKQRLDFLLKAGDAIEFCLFWRSLTEEARDSLYNSFEKGQKMKAKARIDEMDKQGLATLGELKDALIEAVEKNDDVLLLENIEGLSEVAIQAIKRKLNAEQCAFMDEVIKQEQAA